MAPKGRKRGQQATTSRQTNTTNEQAPLAPATLLPETSAAHIAKNAENTIEYLHRTINTKGYWSPSADLAVYLKQPLLNLHMLGKEDLNNIWTTALTLIHCMAFLADYHPYWMKLAEKAREWIFAQPYFEVAYVDIVKRACILLGVDAKSMLMSIFSREGSKDGTNQSVLDERPLGNWVEMFLDTPPYSKYYWNKVTNETRWDHPSDPIVHQLTPAERDANFRAQELAKVKAERLAKYLPVRIQINRQSYMAPKPEKCESCVDPTTAKQATVFCQECDVYFCDQCCDATHIHPKKAPHCDTAFRFVDCFGRFGFPYVRHQKN